MENAGRQGCGRATLVVILDGQKGGKKNKREKQRDKKDKKDRITRPTIPWSSSRRHLDSDSRLHGCIVLCFLVSFNFADGSEAVQTLVSFSTCVSMSPCICRDKISAEGPASALVRPKARRHATAISGSQWTLVEATYTRFGITRPVPAW